MEQWSPVADENMNPAKKIFHWRFLHRRGPIPTERCSLAGEIEMKREMDLRPAAFSLK
jgi:hypothetical protein